MSTTAAVLTVLAVLWVVAPVLYVQIARALKHESTRDRLIREAHERAAGGRAIEELDAHLDAYADQVAGLYEQPPVSPDPVLAAGHARLTDAIHNDQNRGDQP